MRQRLIIIVPPSVPAATVIEALAGGDVAAVIVAGSTGAAEALVAAAQRAGTAALLDVRLDATTPSPWPLAHGVDGLHVFGAAAACCAAVESRPEGATIGALASTRHEAMILGEAGADYVAFGRPASLDEAAMETAAWWSALFEVPAVAVGPHEPVSLGRMIATGAEFVAVDVFSDAGDGTPAERVARINARLDAAKAAS